MTADRSDVPATNEPIAPGISDDLDAARFRALCACPSIDMHGSSGIDAINGGRLHPEKPGRVHFGAVLNARKATASSTRWGRHAILAIAEDVIQSEGHPLPTASTGDTVEHDAALFRALMRMPRIRVMEVTNGIGHPAHPMADGSRPGRFSFRAEFWPTGASASEQCEPTLGRRCILVLADDLIALANDPAAQDEIAQEREARADAVRTETEKPHGMEQIVDTIERIAKRIPNASVSSIGMIQHQLAVVAEYMKLSNSLSVVPLPALRAVKTTRTAADMALRARVDEIVANARRLIDALPKDRRSRSVLWPIASESDLILSVGFGATAIDQHFFKHGTKSEVLLDGGLVDHVGSHAVSIIGDELVIDGIGRWPLDDIVATSTEDGFAFLLANGQLVEIQPAQ